MRLRLRIDSKYIVIFFVIFGILIYLIMNNQVTQVINNYITEKLSSDNHLGYSLLNQKYPGDWSIINDQLYKGPVLMNGNHEVVDEVQKQTHSLATIFMGDTRIATTVLNKNGIRAEGTKAEPKVSEQVLKKGEEYTGEAIVNTKMCRTEYIPLRDSSNKVIGMWFVGMAIDQINQQMSNINYLLGILTIMVILIGIGISWYYKNSIIKPVGDVTKSLFQISQQITGASNQLSASAGELSLGSAEQASAIEETSSTLQETGVMLQQNTSNTAHAAQLSEQAEESANRGDLEMQEMMNSMQEIKKSSDRIAKIIKVIDDIAFQTNILALNAAIEAARAGEAGMGFGVVAEEVRNLAQRSAQAARDTASIIETNIELSGKGVAMAERVRGVLTDITTQAKKVNELMAEISAASREQALGVEQVNKAMNQIEAVTQQSVANAEESAAAAEQLNAQADSMKRIVNELAELMNGETGVTKTG